MLFNSINFAIFLPIVFILYWFICNKSLRIQNILLLVSSYFLCLLGLEVLFLLIFYILDYFTGIKMYNSTNLNYKKIWFWISVSINLGFLGIFKYYNFFAESFSTALSQIGIQINPLTLKYCVTGWNIFLYFSWFILCNRYL